MPPILAGFLTALAAIFVLAVPARAATETPWVRNDHAALRLIAATDGAGADGRLRLGLEFRLRPGWKIYWRDPGDAGVPPSIDWAGSENLASSRILWPRPHRFTIFGLTTLVYGGEVVLPIDVKYRDPARPLTLRARVSYLVCEKICVPYDTPLALTLDGGGASSAHARLIADYAARVPPRVGDPAHAPMGIKSAALVRGDKGLSLQILARAEAPFTKPDVFVEGPGALRFGLPEVERSADGRSALIRMPATVIGQGGAVPASPHLTLTLVDGPRAIEQTVTADSHDAASVGTGITVILLIALLGGLILNLMPCVLPVLSLKVLSVVGHGGGEARAVRRGFVATAAGIVFSFLVLAAIAIGLKEAGAAVGWGIQFQEPVFLAVMAVVVTLFAANLFGWFEVPLPGFAGRLGASGGQGGGSLGGAFATGAFATLLATPCSAPFLGTAIGFALSRGVVDILAVFSTLGLGLALPYLAVAAFPALAVRLPRPGRWMVRLRAILGLALVATAAWLVSILWTLVRPAAGLVTAVVLLAVLALLALRHFRPVLRGAAGLGAIALAAVLAVAAPALIAPAPRAAASVSEAAIDWRPFDKVEILNRVAAGEVVFVDVTAEWCVTCKANKALVVDRGRVAAALAGGKVVAMRADWTRPDPRIGDYLRSFGRFGIPFNAVYGPGAPQGIALPEILTERAVLDAFAKAGARQ